MPRLGSLLFLLVLLPLTACQRHTPPADGGEAAAVPDAPPASERRWHAVLPCADCSGIDTELALVEAGDHREYLLTESYLGVVDAGDSVFHSQGSWDVVRGIEDEPDAIVFRLDPGDAARTRAFLLREDGALEPLDRSQRRIRTRLDHVLAPLADDR